VARGRALFDEGRCKNCHAGPLWTLATRYYTPIVDSNFTALTLASQGVATVGQVFAPQLTSTDTSVLTVLSLDVAGGPARHTCVVRKVGTFDVKGPDDRGADELRVNGAAAQGADGFSVPSLLGLARGAPYLHHGGAETLEQLLDPNGDFFVHLRAGNLNFTPDVDEVADLAAFLRSIDDDAEGFDLPVDQNICPAAITP
jgi:cytochrome c peroxidase